jgi:O-acetylserine/cysteine efflux transporter
MPTRSLPLPHALLALATVAIWGTNFPIIKLAVDQMPPLLVAALRFLFVFVPAALFVPRPAVPLRQMAAYGLLIGVGQFGLLYIALTAFISPGLTSLIVQTQVFFTILLSILIAKETVAVHNWLGLALAAGGIVVIGLNRGGDATLVGILMVLGAALSWSIGNMVGKAARPESMAAFMVWTSLFAFPPLLVLSLLVEGPAAIGRGLASAGLATWAAVLWQALGNALFGYTAWGFLLSKHPAALIVPSALLVPVFGMASSTLWLGEPMPAWKLIAAGLVIAGLAINLLWPMLRR